MKIKRLLKHTIILLRTALLLGAAILVNTQAQAQTLPVTEDMPSAFDFMNPGNIIGDGNYYYIQFYFGSDISYLSDQGAGNAMRSKDYIPFAKNLQWTLVSTGTANQFKLKSLNGIFAYLDNGTYKGTTDENTASTFTFYNHSGGGYDIGTTEISDKAMAGNDNTGPWVAVYNNNKGNARCRLRVGKLKDNVAHIIYWQEPIYKDGNVVDRNTNTRGGSAGFTQHHYLTNSGTNDNHYAISSRKSILWYYDVWQLPTAAAYHQDGLWTLESAGDNGEFYIKKYGSLGEYLNYDGSNASILGTKNADYGKYVLESPGANRYTRIKNCNKFDADALTADMFYEWNGCRADATKTESHHVDIYFGNNYDLSPGGTVYGDNWTVHYLHYADLTDYTKIVFEGSEGLELRVLMNRDVPDGSDGDWGGAFLERRCTIGSDGKAEVDLSDLAYAHLNSIKVQSGSGQVSSITLVKPKYDVTRLANSQFYNWDGYGADARSTSSASVTFNVGNNVTLNPWDVVVGTGEVKCLVYANLTGTAKMVFEGTPGMQLRVQMNRQVDDNGPITERNTTIGAYGKAEVDLSDLPYIHLNAIKVANGSPSGTISSIKLMSTNSGGNNFFMSCANTDGNAVTQKSGTPDDYWYAGFLPVEVPVPNKDEFYQVVMGLNPKTKNQIALTGGNMTVSNQVYAGEKVIGATFTPTDIYQNAFQYKPFNTRSYKQIVINFGSEVPGQGGWTLHTYGGQLENLIELTGKTKVTVDLTPGTQMDDFTIFNKSTGSSITITEIYFTPDLPLQMLNHGGGTSDYSEVEGECQLWQLEQVDDYTTFRVKDKSTGKYLKGPWQMTEPNDPDDAETKDIDQYLSDFYIKWFFSSPAVKEILVDHYVRHKESYLRAYADKNAITDQEGLRKQGLVSDVDSDWKRTANDEGDPYLLDGFIQQTNHFEITHYLKKGDSKVIEFPTVLNRNNDHIFFQRFYNFSEDDTQMDLANLKAHVSLDTRDDGSVQYFLYKNGMVTGQKLKWPTDADGGFARNEQRRFNFTNSSGQSFTVGVDVSRYSDLEYLNPTNPLDGDLQEPSLTMRYLFHMYDAKDMATRLTGCTAETGKWLEEKEFHFGRTQVPYTKFKKVGYRGEFIGLRHLFSDYWVYDNPNLINDSYVRGLLGLPSEEELAQQGFDQQQIQEELEKQRQQIDDYRDLHLVSAVNDNESGKLEVEVIAGNTGIRRGGYNPVLASSLAKGLNDQDYDDNSAEDVEANYQGFYFYDLLSPSPKHEYGNSRFVVFRYPKPNENGIIQIPDNACGPENPAYVNVYFNNGGTRYQLAQFKLIFDKNMATRPWTEIKNGTSFANGINKVKNEDRDPRKLRMKAGNPIAKITFDYPIGNTYHYPSEFDANSTDGVTKHNGGNNNPGGTIANSSPVPLTFGHTNYSFDGDYCNWGSYAMVTTMETHYGNQKIIVPADDDTYGYGLPADEGMQKAFMYIDASEQPGDICAVEFEGEFCANDQLMCTGWISGSNMIQNDTRCPGSITLTVKGEDIHGQTNTIYRFCPGQIYELDNGYGDDGEGYATAAEDAAGIDGNGNGATHVVWQQFYFEFSTDQKYERYWLEVNNNCVSSNGGDFMLDNVEVYTIVPEVTPEINTPICVKRDANNHIVYDMQFLKLKVDHNKLLSSITKQGSSQQGTQTPYLGIVFLEKEKFLRALRTELGETSVSLEEMAERVESGYYDNTIDGGNDAYQKAFKAALLRTTDSEAIWKSDASSDNIGAGILYFKWDKTFTSTIMPQYTFKDAVNKTSATYRDTEDGVNYLILNGNYPELPWKTNTDYYIVPSNTYITSFAEVYNAFNICSNCSKASVFQIEPPYTVLGLESAETTSDYVVCEGQKPTMLLDLKGYDFNGNEVDMKDLNYDWWLGNETLKATLENYHSQHKVIDGEDVYLDKALASLRAYFPNITSLDGVAVSTKTPNLTTPMIKYLRQVVDAGQLVLHQKSISVPAKAAGEEDPYFYIVACPIHDEMFTQALNPTGPYSVIKNGNMERTEVSSFYMGDPSTNGNKIPVTITAGVGTNGSRGFSITSSGNATESAQQDHDTQFFIKAKEIIPIGTMIHLEFDSKASIEATVSTQAHSTPGNYNDYEMLGDLIIPTDWKHFEFDIPVTDVMGNGRDNNKNNSFQTIAFNLWKTRSEITYYFDNVVFTYPKKQYVSFYCDEPQGYRVKVGEKAPTLKTGFVPFENGFDNYVYPTNSDPVLSIRLAKKAQFETVQHGKVSEAPNNGSTDTNLHYLWLPIRNAEVESNGATGVIKKSDDYNVYLASTDDPVWDKKIYESMSQKAPSLPIVGKIVQLNGIDTKGKSNVNQTTNRLCIYFIKYLTDDEDDDKVFEVREGYNYLLSLPFKEDAGNNACDGTIVINMKIVPDYEVWTGGAGNTDWNNDENWRRADGNTSPRWNANDELYVGAATNDSPLKGYKTNDWNYRTDNDRVLRKGFAPLYCTHVLIKSDEWGNAPQLYDAIDGNENGLTAKPFPNLRDTSTPILKYDMQARLYDIWEETYGVGSTPVNKGRSGDLLAEMYQINSCDEIAFQSGTEMKNAHLLNYNNAWVEYQLDNKRWYLLGSPLQGTISGEWYAPTGTAKQETTYYDPVRFNDLKPNDDARYDRYSPAIYQRSWDKAKAVLYEVGATWDKDDDKQDANLGDDSQGLWSGSSWSNTGADDYLDRLGYKPMGGKKVNVAIEGVWSNTYNDAQVDYANGGFSVMVMNHLKNNDGSGGKSIIRLPKEDTMYDYYEFSQDGSNDGGTDTYLIDHDNEQGVQNAKGRAKNRGRLKTDLLLPTSAQKQEKEASSYRYGDRRMLTRIPIKEGELNTMLTGIRNHTETVAAGVSNTKYETVPADVSNLGYYLVENPFPYGLNMNEFFKENSGLQKKYWLLTATGQHLVQEEASGGDWISQSGGSFAAGKAVVAPGQGFFVQTIPPTSGSTTAVSTTITYTKGMQAQSRYGVKSGTGRTFEIEVGRTQVTTEVQVDVDEDGTPETVTQIVYEDDGVTPKTTPIMQDVVIYDYVQTTDADKQYPLQSRQTRGETATDLLGLVITAQRGESQSSALVMQRSEASNDFLPEEDTETFINSDLRNVPTVYTLCGRLATTINSIHDFVCLPLGVESASDAPCTLTFQGVEALGDSVAFYDAVEQKLTPLQSGMQFTVSGQTQNRYYLVRSLNMEEAATETHLQIFTKGMVATVIASTQEPITSVRCYDTAGRLIHTASPQTSEYSFSLPRTGIYIIEAETENDRKTKKVMTR